MHRHRSAIGDVAIGCVAACALLFAGDARAAAVCYSLDVAMQIAMLSVGMMQLQIDGDGNADVSVHEARIKYLVQTNCLVVASYPAIKTRSVIPFDCEVLSGDMQTTNNTTVRVYWTQCPDPVE
jgi:hypothetical protein